MIEERISGTEDTIESIDSTVIQNAKCKKFITQNIQKIQDKMRRPNLRIMDIQESEDLQQKGSISIFRKIIKENFPNLKKEMPMSIQKY